MATNGTITGWYSPQNERGTFDILKTCVGTIILLCWSSVCPNVPSQVDTFWAKYGPKLSIFLLALVGPDFVLVLAAGQANLAWKAKKLFKEAGYPGWTMRHCFFVNMGGIHLRFPDREAIGETSFPVNCNQILYLVRRNYINMPEISMDDINDRNKADGVTRFIAIIQSLWFTIDSFGRIAQGLALTTVELTTLAFVFLMTLCSICWWRKPMDISRPVFIKVDVTLSRVLDEANMPAKPLGRTPLSFIDRHEWFMSHFWFYYVQILRKLKLASVSDIQGDTHDHFSSIDFPKIDLKWELYAAPFVVLYSGIFLSAWNFEFPTATERLLWRTASIATLGYGAIGDIVAGSYDHGSEVGRRLIEAMKRITRCFKTHQKSTQQAVHATISDEYGTAATKAENTIEFFVSRASRRFDRIRNLAQDKDPVMAIPLRWSLPVTFLCFMYGVSRLFILIEDLVALRSLPASAYQTVNYGLYAPFL